MSQTARKTARNTALLIAFEVANPLLSLILVGTMSRRLGAEGLGAYNLLLNFFFLAHSFTSLGLNTLITREVARQRDKAVNYLGSSSVLGMGGALVGMAGFLAILHLAEYGAEVERAGWLVALALVPSVVILYSEAIFVAHEKIQFIVYMAMGENVAKVLIGLWLLYSGAGVIALIGSFTLLRYVTLAVNLVLFHRQIAPLAWKVDPGLLRDLARHIPVFGSILIVATLHSRVDVLLLSKLATLSAVGYYTAAYRLLTIAQVVPKSFNVSLYPVLANLFAHAPEKYRRAKGLSIRYSLVALLPLAAGVYGLASPIVRLLFGPGFAEAVPVLQVVIWTVVIYGVTKVLVSSLFASNRQAVDLKVNLLALLANLAANLALIPRYGALGSAWATLISYGFFLACQIFYMRHDIFPILREAEVLRPALAASAILLWLHFTPEFPLPGRVLGGALVYGVLLFLLQVVKLQDLRLVLPERLVGLLPKIRGS